VIYQDVCDIEGGRFMMENSWISFVVCKQEGRMRQKKVTSVKQF